MKLQYLAIIFLIIILPIVLVLSVYVDYHIDAINLKHTYDTKLLDATYDSLKSYQLNTVNNAISDISASKIEELEAAVKTFYNSLTTTYGYTGYKSTVMEDYVPAVVFAMYDGYYIYAPYRNVLTGVQRVDEDGDPYVDSNYEDNKLLHGLKSYVYYSCRYKIDNNNDFVITYTLDNYITIQGTVGGNYVNKYGYLIDGIEELTTDYAKKDIDGDDIEETLYDYKYDGVTFEYDEKEECLKEYLDDTEYSYVKINGTKYYLDKNETSTEEDDTIFYINGSGERAIQASFNLNKTVFYEYKDYIEKNNSAYRYYRDAYNFTKWVRNNLSDLTSEFAVDENNTKIEKFGKYEVFGIDRDYSDNITSGPDADKYIQDSDSDFNAHRSEVIRYTIEKNLSTAIAGYNNYFKNSEAKFIMPNITETDWEVIENNISIITFLQGFKIGGRDYNEYCAVANNLNKEYVDENDIYVLGKNDNTYYKVNDETINSTGKLDMGKSYTPGVWKLNFEKKVFLKGKSDEDYEQKTYFPISYKNNPSDINEKPKAYLGSYSSIIASTSVDASETDMYKYMRAKKDDGITPEIEKDLKTTYYTALARERYGQYSVNNDIEIKPGELEQNNTSNLDDYVDKITLEVKHGDKETDNWENLGEDEWTNKEDIKLIGNANDTNNIIEYYLNTTKSSEYKPVNPPQQEFKHEEVREELKDKEVGEYRYYFSAKDGPGNTRDVNRLIKIDKKPPEIKEFTISTEGWTNEKKITLTGVMQDEDSGITNYSIITSDTPPENYDYNISATTQEKEINVEINEEGRYYLHVKDQAGNTACSEPVEVNIDTLKPEITVDPSSLQEWEDEIDITIKITDLGGSGVKVNENNEVTGVVTLKTFVDGIIEQDGEQKEEKVEVSEHYNYTAKMNEEGDLVATITIGKELSGIYKLYVGRGISDNAGNVLTEDKLIGEFRFDNEAPDIELEINENENNSTKDVVIKLKDELSGLKSDKGVCYLSTSSEKNTKTERYEFTSGQPIQSIGKKLTGTYYIWVDSVSDNLGNATGEIMLGEIELVALDEIAPTVTVTPESAQVCKEKQITITLADEGGSGLKSNQGTYYLSSIKDDENEDYIVEDGTYTSGQPFTIGKDLTGRYYLWVRDVEDNAGNVNKKHFVGEFIFDNEAPTIINNSFKVTGTDETSISVEVSAVDSGEAGIATYKYYIALTGNTEYTLAGQNNTTSTTDSYTYQGNLNVGSQYSIYVIVTDKLGNSSVKSETIVVKLADNYMITTGTTKQYKSTLADALSVASNNSKITVLKSLEDDSEAIIDNKTNLTIDLNGNTITRNETITITSTSSVEFAGKGYIKTQGYYLDNNLITNAGNCIINFEEDYGIVGKNDVYYSKYWEIRKGIYYTLEGYYYTSGVIHNSGTLIIESGKLEQKGQGSVIELGNNSVLQIENGNITSQGYTAIDVSGTDTSNMSIIMNDGVIENIGQTADAAQIENAYGNGIYFRWEYNKNAKITINGGKIISNNSSAIYSNSANPTIEIFGGIVSGKKYGIEVRAFYTSKYLPEVVIGNINDEYNKEAVKVVGGQHAMYMNTEKFKAFNVYFYNGILETTSIDNDVLSGAYIQEIRPSSTIIDEKDSTSHYKYLDKVDTDRMYAIKNNFYPTLQEAVTAANNGDTIVLLKNGTDSSIVEVENKDITLLLNAYTLTKTTNSINIGKGATLTVTGNNATLKNQNIIGFTVSGTVKMYGKVNISTTTSLYPIFDTDAENAVIDINNGIITASGSGTRVVNMDNKGTCYIRGMVSITLNYSSYGVYNSSNGAIIHLEGGTIIVNSSYGVYNTSNMECSLGVAVDMQVNSSAYGIYNNNTSSGTISSREENPIVNNSIYLNAKNSIGIYNQADSTTSIEFNENIGICYNLEGTQSYNGFTNTVIYNAGSGNIKISSGYYMGAVYGIQNTGTGNITIEGGSIREGYYAGYFLDWAAIHNSSTGKVTVDGGTICGNIGIYNTGNTNIEIKKGDVYTERFDTYQGYYAIYNANSNAKIIIGDKQNSNVSITYPSISSKNTTNPAIYTNSSTFEFYNGIIKSGNKTIYNREPNVRWGYCIENGTKDDSYYYHDSWGNIAWRDITLYTAYLVKDPNITEDVIEPTVTVTPDSSEVSKSKQITITLTDDRRKRNTFKQRKLLSIIK